MTVKHTPGPWAVIRREGMARMQYGDCISASHYSRPGITDGRDDICSVSGPDRDANASLIAAAPDLLELAIQYADECVECRGLGVVDTRTQDPQDSKAIPCPECAHIWAVIDRAEGRA